MTETRVLDLAEITLDKRAQPRVTMNFNMVQEFADDMIRGDPFPPLDVFSDGVGYWLADGFHRYRAAEALGLAEFHCVVHDGGLDDAVWFSLAANRKNGLRRDPADVRNAVKRAILHRKGQAESDLWIADYIGTSFATVARVRQLLVATTTVLPSQSRVDRNGVERVLPQPRAPEPAAAADNVAEQIDPEEYLGSDAKAPPAPHMDRSNDWIAAEMSAIAAAHRKLPDPVKTVGLFPVGLGYVLTVETAESILDWWAEFVPLWAERYPEFRAFVETKLRAIEEKLSVCAD
jgi:hypothetical protein